MLLSSLKMYIFVYLSWLVKLQNSFIYIYKKVSIIILLVSYIVEAGQVPETLFYLIGTTLLLFFFLKKKIA